MEYQSVLTFRYSKMALVFVQSMAFGKMAQHQKFGPGYAIEDMKSFGPHGGFKNKQLENKGYMDYFCGQINGRHCYEEAGLRKVLVAGRKNASPTMPKERGF